ncbi:Avirulence protein [Noviherbaspirillum humi]|uniref:Avirulence protein n=1 Tax=Noviherbaspirillum humi TaxID=1688639 RepID=A0A239I1U8_9BURK|nr:hypothetical protein [Noviherbaspirillum humi]SNS87228.1 Avirulence protein [Noviherbaspirillum humi]
MPSPSKVANQADRSFGSQTSLSFPSGAFDQFSQSATRSQGTGKSKPVSKNSATNSIRNTKHSVQQRQGKTRDIREAEPLQVEINGRLIETRLREHQVWDVAARQWRTVGIYADGYAEASASNPNRKESIRDTQLLIRDAKGKNVIDLQAARRRMEQIIAHGGWTKLTVDQAQTVRAKRIEVLTKPIVPAKFEAYKSRYGLTEAALQRMNQTQRYQWLGKAATRGLGNEVGAQVRQLLTPQTAFVLLSLAALQASGAGTAALLINTGLGATQAKQIGQDLYEVHQATQSNNVYEMDQAAVKLTQVAGQLLILIGPTGMAKLLKVLPNASAIIGKKKQPSVEQQAPISLLSESAAGRVHQVPGFTKNPAIGKVFSQYMHIATVRLAPLVKAGKIDAKTLWGALTEARYQVIQGGPEFPGEHYFGADKFNYEWYVGSTSRTTILNNRRYHSFADRIFKLFPDETFWKENELRGTMYGKIHDENVELTSYKARRDPKTGALKSLEIESPTGKDVSLIAKHLDELMQAALSAPTNAIAIRYLAEMHWWLAQTCPNLRGSAAVSDAFVRTVAQARGIKLGEWKTAPDLEAIFSGMKTFVEAYPTFFKSPSSGK